MAKAQGRARKASQVQAIGGLDRPLESLLAVLPFILLYELGSLWLESRHQGPPGGGVVASYLLERFLTLFGSGGRWMPGLTIVAILLGVQIASAKPWRVRAGAVPCLYAEAIAWTAPLLLTMRFLHLASAEATEAGWSARVLLGIGAGVYEELVFRLILICGLVMIATDLLGIASRPAVIFAVAASALFFAAHHHPPLGGEPFDILRFSFRAVAGAYLGLLFLYRGYAVAACTHVAYNVILLAALT